MSHIRMEHEQQHQQQHHHRMAHGEQTYHDGSGQQWVEPQHVYHTPQHQSPVQEYGGFNFTPLPMEPIYGGMPPPPRTTHQQLQPLILPPQMPQWPSQITSQSSYMAPTYSTVPMSMAPPMTTPVAGPPTGSTRPTPTPRKTLTDDDRRRMCQYAEKNPNVKQTEIGAMFGVERSTVSKVLRQKEKYLYQEDGSRSPARKQKGKFPDIERALMNWIRNQQKRGLPITDVAIKEKARFFATTVGSPESHQKANSTSWLEKFKQKNNIGAKSRKASLAGDSEASNPASGTQSPSNVSPVSPTSGSPLTGEAKPNEVAKHENDDTFADFAHGHRPFHSASNPALPSVFHSHMGSSFSPAPTSPTSPFYTPDSVNGPSPFIPIQPRDTPQPRPRSQTFPVVGAEPFSPPSSGTMTPKYFQAPALDSPIHDFTISNSAIDEMIAEPSSTTSSVPPSLMAASESGSVIASPPLPSTITSSTMPLSIPATAQVYSSPITPASISIPSSPSQEDARKALETLMNFFQQQPTGFVEPQEYMTMGKLMEKLKLHSHHGSHDSGMMSQGHGLGLMRPSLSRSGTGENLNGLASIPEGHM